MSQLFSLRMHPPVPEIDDMHSDWSQLSTLHAFVGVYAYGWAKPRMYPPDFLFRRWFNLLPPDDGAQPFPPGTEDKLVKLQAHRIMATIRNEGLWRLGDFFDFERGGDVLTSALNNLNELQGIAWLIVEHLEAIYEPRHHTLADQIGRLEAIHWERNTILRERIADVMYLGRVPGIDVTNHDWRHYDAHLAMAGVIVAGWATPRQYPDHAVFKAWFMLLPNDGEPWVQQIRDHGVMAVQKVTPTGILAELLGMAHAYIHNQDCLDAGDIDSQHYWMIQVTLAERIKEMGLACALTQLSV